MKNKLITKIFSILCVVSILLSLFAITASADVGTSSTDEFLTDDNHIIYHEAVDYNHGIPLSVALYGTHWVGNDSTYDYQNSFILNDFGVTYIKQSNTDYIYDQYPRYEFLTSYNHEIPIVDLTSPFVYSHYSRWNYTNPGVYGELPMSYSYFCAPIGKPLTTYGNSENWEDMANVLDYAIEASDGYDIMDFSTACSSDISFNYQGQLSADLLRLQNSYFPEYLSVYCLVPVQNDGLRPYYNIRLDGYSIGSEGKENKSVTVNSGLDDYFVYSEVGSYDVDNSFPTIGLLGAYYDDGLGLPTYKVDLDGIVVSDLCDINGIDVVTDFSINFGLFYYTTNNQVRGYYDEYGNYPKIAAEVTYDHVEFNTQLRHDNEVYIYIRSNGMGSNYPVFPLNWLGNTVSGVLDVNLFGSFGLGDILFVVIGIGIFIAFIKVFAGG